MFLRFLIVGFLVTLFAKGFTQEEKTKGMYFFWGWNRAKYTNSDIHFTGTNYDFTLHNAVATDRQTKFALDPYFHPAKITIPQTNLRIGYRLNETWDVSFGDDHMKYVVKRNQTMPITGTIDGVNPAFNNTYNTGDSIKFTPEFMKYEHTDGLNYVNFELRYRYNLMQLIAPHFEKIKVNSISGLGIGFMLPRTNVTFSNYPRHDEFHLAGFGLGAVQSISLMFYDHLFIQTEVKAGYINMPDIRTTPYKADRAAQHFSFLQWNFVFGWEFKF
tara:strand:- start:2925 stop:3743 length:819 start_codon:yes stop_codon:yes gene_type:complete